MNKHCLYYHSDMRSKSKNQGVTPPNWSVEDATEEGKSKITTSSEQNGFEKTTFRTSPKCTDLTWRCTVCGYLFEADKEVKLTCPNCSNKLKEEEEN